MMFSFTQPKKNIRSEQDGTFGSKAPRLVIVCVIVNRSGIIRDEYGT